MQVRLIFCHPGGSKELEAMVYHYCDNLSVKKERDYEVYDRSEDVSYYNFTVEFDCYIVQNHENAHLRFEHVFSIEVI